MVVFCLGKLNKPDKIANTILSSMVVCMRGGPKFLCKMLPVKELDADFLFEQTNILLTAIKSAGGDAIAIICAGNRVNQSFFKKFDRVEPWRTRDNIFLLFDFVHIMKNIGNNWITEETQELKYIMDREAKVSRWSDLKRLHQLESDCLVKLPKLTEVMFITRSVID